MNLYQIARALGGEVSNGWARVPAPGHSKADRSLSIALSHQSPDGLYYLPYAGETWQECAEYVRSRLGITPERRERQTAKRQSPQPPQSGPSDARKRANAREIFSETVEPRDTIVERYFEVERGLPNIIDDVLAMTIRYHARCPFKDDDKLVRAPALVAALRDPHAAMHACSHLDDMDAIERRFLADPANVVAVQRIRLDADGHKVERRSLGPLGNGVVFVSSIFESFYSATATLAEGVEVGVSRAQAGLHRRRGDDGLLALQDALSAMDLAVAHHMRRKRRRLGKRLARGGAALARRWPSRARCRAAGGRRQRLFEGSASWPMSCPQNGEQSSKTRRPQSPRACAANSTSAFASSSRRRLCRSGIFQSGHNARCRN